MTQPTPRDDVLSGRNENSPFRAMNRVALVIAIVFVIVCAVAYGLWTALN